MRSRIFLQLSLWGAAPRLKLAPWGDTCDRLSPAPGTRSYRKGGPSYVRYQWQRPQQAALRGVIERMHEQRAKTVLPRWTDPKQNNRDGSRTGSVRRSATGSARHELRSGVGRGGTVPLQRQSGRGGLRPHDDDREAAPANGHLGKLLRRRPGANILPLWSASQAV